MDLQLDNLIFLILLLTTIVYWAGIIYTDFKLLSKISFYGTVAANGLIFTGELIPPAFNPSFNPEQV